METAMQRSNGTFDGEGQEAVVRRPAHRRHPITLFAASLGGVTSLVFGVWAFVAPASFAEAVAFPYHEHFLHDVGAFQIGVGVALLLALMWADGLAVALGGYVAACGVHLASHLMDRGLGGHDADAPGLAVLLLIGVVGLTVRGRDLRIAARHEREATTVSPSDD